MLKTVLELHVSPVDKIAVSPLISHFGPHILCTGLDGSGKNRCPFQNVQNCWCVTCVIKSCKWVHFWVRRASDFPIKQFFVFAGFVWVVWMQCRKGFFRNPGDSINRQTRVQKTSGYQFISSVKNTALNLPIWLNKNCDCNAFRLWMELNLVLKCLRERCLL